MLRVEGVRDFVYHEIDISEKFRNGGKLGQEG